MHEDQLALRAEIEKTADVVGADGVEGKAERARRDSRLARPVSTATPVVDISRGRRDRSHMEPSAPVNVPVPPVSSEGVDLTQIRPLKRVSPAERLSALTIADNNLLRLRRNARRFCSRATEPHP
jgi:hypothetical protein